MTEHIKDPKEKEYVQNEIYRKVLPIVENEKKFSNRDQSLNEFAYQTQQQTDL